MYNTKSLIFISLLTLLTAATCAFSMQNLLDESKQKRYDNLSGAEHEVDRRLEILKNLTNYKPDRPFNEAVKTDLFYFLRQMPKGASLHSHYTALLSASEFFDICMNTPNVFIYTANTDSKHFHGELMLSENGSGIPEGFESFTTAAKNLGRSDILKAWTIGSEDEGKNSGEILNMSCKIIDEPEVFPEYYRRAFMEHARDGLQRLEVIINPSSVTGEKLQKMLEAYKSVQKEYPDFTVKFIANAGKNETLEVCPISDQILDHISDLREHPALNYLI